MIWVIVFASIAVAGLAMVVGYGVWLAHKAADVMSEVSVLTDRGGQLMALVGEIHVPATSVTGVSSTGAGTPQNQFAPKPDDVG